MEVNSGGRGQIEIFLRHAGPASRAPPYSCSFVSANGVIRDPGLFLHRNEDRPRPHTPDSTTKGSDSRSQSREIHAPNRVSKKKPRGDTTVHHKRHLYEYIFAAVKNTSGMLLYRIIKEVLHGIHSITPPLVVTGNTGGNNPISMKELHK